MYSKQAIRKLGVTPADLTNAQRDSPDEKGFFIAEGVYSAHECAEMAADFDRLSQAEGDQGGHEVHIEPGAPRVSNIFNKTPVFDRTLACPPMLAASHYLLGEFKLHGANLHQASLEKTVLYMTDFLGAKLDAEHFMEANLLQARVENIWVDGQHYDHFNANALHTVLATRQSD